MHDWARKRILITGATGFIGSWLTERLVNSGANVSVFVKKDDPFGLDAITHIANKLKIFWGDISDFDSVKNAVQEQDLIFHLAAVSQVAESKLYPLKAFHINLLGTLNVLEAVRKQSDSFIVYVSTDKVYGEPKFLPITEEHPLGAKSPYDASKVAAEKSVKSFHSTYGIKVGVVRPSNTVGGRDANILRAAPDFILSLINNRPIIIRGNGKQIRDYIYIDDTVNGILKIAENQNRTNGEAFNIGTGKPTSVLELANSIMSCMNLFTQPIISGNELLGEIELQYLSYEKAKNILGWEPKVSLKYALIKTVEWYRNNSWWQDVMKRVGNYENLSSRG